MYIIYVCVCHCWCKSVLINYYVHPWMCTDSFIGSQRGLMVILGRKWKALGMFSVSNAVFVPAKLWRMRNGLFKILSVQGWINQNLSTPFKTKIKLPLLQHLANSPLKPRLDRHTSLVHSELKRTIYVISRFGIICFVLSCFIHHVPNHFQRPNRDPQPSSIHYLAINFGASTCVWTRN